MGAGTMLVRRSLRKAPTRFAIVGLLVAVAATLLHAAFVLAIDFPASLTRTADRLNAEHFFIHLDNERAAADAERRLASTPHVLDYETLPGTTVSASFEYNGSQIRNPHTVLGEHGVQPRIGRTETIEELPTRLSDPIWLPNSMRSGGGYKLGDPFTMTVGGIDYRFHIQGFFETPMHGLLQMGLIELQVDAGKLSTLSTIPGASPTWQVRATLDDRERADDVRKSVASFVSLAAAAEGRPDPIQHSIGWNVYLTGQTLTATIFSVTLIAFALLIAIVVAVVVRFVIRSSVVRDMRAIGSLEACGFRPGQMTRSLATPFVVVAVACATLGSLATGAVLPVLGRMLESQTGIRWPANPSPVGMALAVGAMLVVVVVVAFLSAVRVRSVAPVEALRGGERTHSFRADRLPLDGTRGPVALLLGLKSALHARAQSTMVILVIAVAVAASVFSTALYSMILGNPREFVRTITGETGDVSMAMARGASVESIRGELSGMPGVRKIVPSDSVTAATGGTNIALQIAEDFALRDHDPSYEGRMPVRANEIALAGRLADSLGLKVGDDVTLDRFGRKATYLVTGLTQSSVNLGMNASVTVEGARSLTPDFQPRQVDVYLERGRDKQAFMDEIRQRFAGGHAEVFDQQKYFDSVVDAYLSASSAISIGILTLTAFVVLLVVVLVVGSSITTSRHALGVLKALGFTNRQISGHALAAHLPPIVAGVLAGLAIGEPTATPLLEYLLRNIGIMKLDANLPIAFVIGLGAAFVALASGLTLLMMRRTRAIAPHELLCE